MKETRPVVGGWGGGCSVVIRTTGVPMALGLPGQKGADTEQW